MAGRNLFANQAPQGQGKGRNLFASATNPEFAARAAQMDPIDLQIARSKNDDFGAYLRDQAQQRQPGESEAQQHERLYGKLTMPEVSIPEGMTRSHVQGSSLGAGDETVAGVASTLNPNITYNDALIHERARLNQFREEHPILAYGSEIAGSIPTSLVSWLNVTKLGPWANALLTGTGQGTIYGFNSGEGVQDRAESAGIGAGLGLGLSAATMGAGQAVSNIAARSSRKAAADQLGVSTATMDIMDRVMRADDSLTGTGAQRMAAAGPDAMVVDAGPSAQGLLDAAMQSGGPAARIGQEAVESRVASAGQQTANALDEVLGRVGQETRTYAQKPGLLSSVYDTAYSQPIDYSSTLGRQLENMVLNRVPPEAIQAANKLIRASGDTFKKPILADIAEDGTVAFREMPSVQQLDYITRGLNQIVSTTDGQGALGGLTPLGQTYQTLSREIRSNLRNLVPEYDAALKTAADAINARNAKEFGLELLRPGVSRDEVAEVVRHMGGAELRILKEGVRQNIDDIMAQVRATMTDANVDAREVGTILRGLSSRMNRDKLTSVLGQQQADDLFTRLDQATKAYELKASVAQNSKTFARQETGRMVGEQVQRGPVDTLREGEPIQAAREAIAAVLGRSNASKQNVLDAQYEELARILVGLRGQEATNFLRRLEAFGPNAIRRQQIVGERARLLAAPTPTAAQAPAHGGTP